MKTQRTFVAAFTSALLVVLAGAPTSSSASAIALQQVPLAPLKAAADARSVPAASRQPRPGALNQQVVPASNRAKFRAEPARTGEDVYIVRLRDLPVATYDGRTRGYAATTRAAGAPAGAAAAYRAYLANRQQSALRAVRATGITAAVRHQFTEAFNGFTLKLTQKQAATVAGLPQVAFVQRSDLQRIQTDRGPTFVRADHVWAGTTAAGVPYKGEGVVVGVLDSGANTDHPAFAATGGDGYVHVNPRGPGNYLGDCATGAATCNAKLIGVWSWPVITGDYAGVRPPSGEDYNGHGSHTASTAAGNVVHDAPLLGSSLGDGDGTPTGFSFPTVSGVAPHANLVAYQVCYPNGGCPDEAILLAVEQAVQDDIDVMNFSIGGAERFPWDDAIALAFLAARESGIAIAASAGNAGPDFYTLSHVAPWYLAVAASTHDRLLDIPPKTLSLRGGATAPPGFVDEPFTSYGGVSAAGIDGLLVDAAAFGDALCAQPFAAGTFSSDQVVVCLRGAVARLAKAANVQAGGAGGFVLVNAGYPSDDDDLLNDVYPLPGIQLHSWDGQALLAWMGDGGSGHRAVIGATAITSTLDPASGDQLADFSSRGPANSFLGHLSPGISAPGVDIYAAYADEHPFHPGSALSRDWALQSGTSMASPHVAGAMALVRQAHPDWSAAEVQSALQMTASETVSHGAAPPNVPGRPAGTYRAGSGRLDVLAAVNAGLVMDESASNFDYANPENGGDVLQLNLPQLVNNHCRDICTWFRTVRATRDGTWNVSTGPWTFERWSTGEGEAQQNGVRMEAFPSSFSLRAGETRTIYFRADLTDAQFTYNGFDHVNGSEEIELWSKVVLTPTDPTIPTSHWPISINFDHGSLPKTLSLTAHREQGSYRLNDVQLPALSATSYRSYGLAAPAVEELVLPQDNDHVPPQFDGDFSNGNTRTFMIDVPADAARVVVENLRNVATTADANWKRGWATIYLGRDADGDNQPDFEDETLCVSNTEVELNYCSITHPDAGRYWAFVNNVRTGLADDDPELVVDTYRLAIAVVPGAAGNGLQLAGPAGTTGEPVDLDVNWTLPALPLDAVVYGGLDVGAANAPGSVGFVPVKITRGLDDVSMTVSQTRARVGDVIDVKVHVRENTSGADRVFDLQSTLPPGLTLVPGSVQVNTAAQRPNLTVTGGTVRVAGNQANSENWARDYRVSTSASDAMCRTPVFTGANGQSSNGGFVGLFNRFGLLPDFGGHADFLASEAVRFPLANFWGAGAGYALYNNAAFQRYPELLVSPQGWVIQEPNFGDTMYIHQQFPYLTLPYTPMIGVLWKGATFGSGFFPDGVDALGTPLHVDFFDPARTSGMVVAYSSATNDLVFEWVGARSERLDFNTGITTTLDDRYDFELVLNRDYRYGDGQYEIQMAYDNLEFGTAGGSGSIGVQGYHGPLTAFGPLDGDLASRYAYDDLRTKLGDNLVVCYDYVGPESTQFDLAFKARVSETAAGSTQLLRFTSQVSGMPTREVEASIQVVGNLNLAPIPDQSVQAGGRLDGLVLVYQDNDPGPNTITVAGAHVTATVHGNQPGATLDLVPEPGFVGSTQVTVTVADQANPGDRDSETFTLTVSTVAPGTIFANGFE